MDDQGVSVAQVITAQAKEIEAVTAERDALKDYKVRREADDVGPDQLEVGSITGMLEAINLHNTLRCNIYPIIGPKRVSCAFDDELKARVIEGLGRYVRVVGTMSYKQWSNYPHSINATEIEVLPHDADLPTLSDLRGLAPDATGEMSSEEFLDALRDGDW